MEIYFPNFSPNLLILVILIMLIVNLNFIYLVQRNKQKKNKEYQFNKATNKFTPTRFHDSQNFFLSKHEPEYGRLGP